MPDKQEFSLYNGEVVLTFAEKSHRYKVSDRGSKPEHCPSVTTILNVLAKPALIEWGVKCACNDIEDNLRALFAGNSFTEQQILNIVTRGRTAHDRVREEAAEIGTSAHDWLRDYWTAVMRKTDLPARPTELKPKKCIENALDSFSMHKMVPVAIEAPLYSREHKICGRVDWIGYIDDEFSVQDYKSTKFLYPEVVLQETFYAMMYYEEGVELPATRWGLRIDKEKDEFEARRHGPETFGVDKETCLAVFKIYDRLKHLRRKPKKEKEDYLAEL
jgi:hypothetical protein